MNLIHVIVSTGIRSQDNFNLKKKVKLTNLLALIGMLGVVVISTSERIISGTPTVNFQIGQGLIFLGSASMFLFNYFRMYKWGNVVGVLFVSAALTYLSYTAGAPQAGRFNLFILMLYSAFVIDNKRVSTAVFVVLALLFTLIESNFTWQPIIALRLSIMLILFYLAVQLFQKEHVKYQKIIENKNSQLLHREKILEEQQLAIEQQNTYLKDAILTKDKLFSVISHDLRSPLASLQATLLLTKDKHISRQEFDLLTDQLQMQVLQLQGMLGNLLDWASANMNQIDAVPQWLQLNRLVAELFALLGIEARKKEIALLNQIPEDYRLYADPNHLRLILRNLLSNALKFSPVGAVVQVGVQLADNQHQIWVQDQGIGISAEQIDCIFNQNMQFTRPGTKGEKGTGIGLRLCQEFAHKNGGRIAVESQTNTGSKFILLLPAGVLAEAF